MPKISQLQLLIYGTNVPTQIPAPHALKFPLLLPCIPVLLVAMLLSSPLCAIAQGYDDKPSAFGNIRSFCSLLSAACISRFKESIAVESNMDQRQINAELSSFALFHNLSQAEIEQIAAAVGEQHCRAGEILIRQGEDPKRIYLVCSGGLKVVTQLQTERPLVLAFLGRGALVGELGIIQAEHGRSAAVIALDETELLWLERRVFKEYLDQSMQLTRNLVGLLAQRLRRANEQTWLREEPSVARRIAWVFSRLAEAYGEQQADRSIAVPFRFVQQDLADLIGSARPRMNQQLGILVDAGLITHIRKQYVVRDLACLWRMAEGLEELPHKESPQEHTG